MNKKLLLIIIFIFNTLYIFSTKIPELFNLKWGSGFDEVNLTFVKLSNSKDKLKYYNVFEGRNEIIDLKSQASIKYYIDNIIYNNIPSMIVVTFYNPDLKKNNIQLSKIEIFLKKKDKDNVWVDTKAEFKHILKNFIDEYLVNIDTANELKIYKIYEYQVVVNSILAHFMANVGNNILDKNTSIYISYENNNLQNLILKKEKELLENY
jgi:hypothetical protein